MLNENLSSSSTIDQDVTDLLIKPAPASFKDQDVLTIFLAIREDNARHNEANRVDVQEMRKLYNEIAKHQVGWDRCTTLRQHCLLENGEKFRDIFQQLDTLNGTAQDYKSYKEQVATTLSLSRAEERVLEKAKEEDEKIIIRIESKFDTLSNSVDQIKDLLVIFRFSRCSLTWLWDNKKIVVPTILFVSAWLLGIDYLAKYLFHLTEILK